MKVNIYSKGKSGKWANSFTLLFIALMILKLSALSTAIRLPFPTPLIAVLGVIGFELGTFSLIKEKDRAILTLLSILVGILIITWAAAEIAFPH